MKIYTITCHDVYNCGASLQAYALQEYLKSLGHDVLIIDYKPDYLSFHYKWSWFVNDSSSYYKKCKNNPLYRFLYVTRRYIKELRTISKVRSFDTFTRKYLNLTKKYSSYEQLRKYPPIADVYIVGSDQVWNDLPLYNGKDPAFYLQFGKNHVKKISYAASFGSTTKLNKNAERWISQLDAVSVREESGLALLLDNQINATKVCDPVFLLGKNSWDNIIKDPNKEKDYILVYNLGPKDSNIWEQAKRLSALTGFPIYAIITKERYNEADKLIENVGPIEFVSLINRAKYVISNSFHATSFSLIFEKEFYSYKFITEKASRRMRDILILLGIENRYNSTSIDMKQLDYELLGNLLSKYIYESKAWLKTQLDYDKN